MRIFISIALAALTLSGCISAYRPPTGAPTAKVRFQTTAPTVPLLFVRTQRAGELTCQQIGNLGTPEVSNINMLGSVKEPRSDRIERLIQAGAPFVVYFQEINGTKSNPNGPGLIGVSCQAPIVFTPKPDGSYEITHGSNNVAELCSIQVSELSQGKSGETQRHPITIQAVDKITCL